MTNLPVLIAVALAAAAIIAVILWRIRPGPPPDSDSLNKRVAEEIANAQTIQAKLDTIQAALNEEIAKAAAAEATSKGEWIRAEEAERRASQFKSELTALQERCDDASKRAAKAEADRAAAQSMTTSLGERAHMSEARLDKATADLKGLQEQFGKLNASTAESATQLKSSDAARRDLEERLGSLAQKYDALQVSANAAVEQSAASKSEAEYLRTQVGELQRSLASAHASLDEERAKLSQALAAQQADEAAANQFEIISKTILEETLDKAKRAVGELTETFQKSSGVELEKHAVTITKTLEPLQAQLTAYGVAVESLKKGTQENYGSLKQQLEELHKTERSLHDQAKALTTALSASPKVKGSYGELILKQLVEFVGMQEKCHFETQAVRDTEDGRKIPDLIVSLPGGQKVIVDAKAVMDACVEAQVAQDDIQRAIWIKKHCENVRSRVTDLASKDYYVDHKDSVEAVVLFLPAENLYATAMENDPGLTEFAMTKNVIICGPNSLMLLLKVSNQLWKRASVEKEANDIKECGEKIYKAACDFVDRFASVGRKIQALESEYNGAVGTFEGRLLPAGRRMYALESVSGRKELGELDAVKDNIRELKDETKRLAAIGQTLPGLLGSDIAPEFVAIGGESA